MTTAAVTTESVVLPVTSLALLGAGPEGVDLLADLGLDQGSFEAGFVALRRRLESAEDAESQLQWEISQRIVVAAAAARGRLSVTGVGGGMVPSHLLALGPQALVVRLHGAVAEWLLVAAEEVPVVVERAVEAVDGVLVTASRSGTTLASAFLRGGEARLASRSEEIRAVLLARADGLDGVVAGLLAVLTDEVPSE